MLLSFTQLLTVRNSYQKYLKTQILLEWFGQGVDQLEDKIKLSMSNNREMLKLILLHSYEIVCST